MGGVTKTNTKTNPQPPVAFFRVEWWNIPSGGLQKGGWQNYYVALRVGLGIGLGNPTHGTHFFEGPPPFYQRRSDRCRFGTPFSDP